MNIVSRKQGIGMATLELGGAWKGLWISGLLGRFVLLCLGVWLHAADTLVTATVTPAIVDEIGGIAYVSWTILLYQIGAIVAGDATALLCRRVGVKRVQIVAALLYGVGCVIAATAPDMATLLVARLLQGIGGGMMVALSYVAIQQSFAEELWGRLFGIVAAIWGAGSLLGPLIGGVFADFGFWRGAFWFFATQAAVLAALALALLPAQPAGEKTEQKWPISPLLLLSAATLLIASAGVAQSVALSVVECLTGVGLLYVAARLDRRSQFRMLPVQTLDLRHPISAGLLMIFALSTAKTGFWAYGPLILKTMFGIDPLISGYIMIGLRTRRAAGARLHTDRLAFIFEHVQPSVPVAGIDHSIPRHIDIGCFGGERDVGPRIYQLGWRRRQPERQFLRRKLILEVEHADAAGIVGGKNGVLALERTRSVLM